MSVRWCCVTSVARRRDNASVCRDVKETCGLSGVDNLEKQLRLNEYHDINEGSGCCGT